MLCSIALHTYCIFFFTLIEGKTFHQQKDYISLYCGSPEPNPCHLGGVPVLCLERDVIGFYTLT